MLYYTLPVYLLWSGLRNKGVKTPEIPLGIVTEEALQPTPRMRASVEARGFPLPGRSVHQPDIHGELTQAGMLPPTASRVGGSAVGKC